MIEFLVPVYLAATSRLHGSNSPTPKILEAALYAAPYAVLVYIVSGNLYLLVAALCAVSAAKNIGTREGFRGYTSDNWLSKVSSFLTEKLGKERNSEFGDAVYNGLKGSLITAFPAACLAFYKPELAAAIFVAGAIGYPISYYVSYYIRQALPDRYKPSSYTVIAEAMSGFLSGLGFLF
jgi:hypothetical protein